jgi:phosphinothricin acetyltransferase
MEITKDVNGGLSAGAAVPEHGRMHIRPADHADAAAIAAIYNHYVATTCITFETDPVSPDEMAARIDEANEARLPWLIAIDGEAIVGYAYASKWKGRCAYRYSAESTVYLDAAQCGKGIGRTLYTALIDALRARSLHAVIGGIALPNDASIALHERLGFEKVAQFKQVGFKQDRWIDVGYWQLLLADAR